MTARNSRSLYADCGKAMSQYSYVSIAVGVTLQVDLQSLQRQIVGGNQNMIAVVQTASIPIATRTANPTRAYAWTPLPRYSKSSDARTRRSEVIRQTFRAATPVTWPLIISAPPPTLITEHGLKTADTVIPARTKSIRTQPRELDRRQI